MAFSPTLEVAIVIRPHCPDTRGGASSFVEREHESTKITYTFALAHHFRVVTKIDATVIHPVKTGFMMRCVFG
jgi:hypothetical protein